jgi:hypothetical protein
VSGRSTASTPASEAAEVRAVSIRQIPSPRDGFKYPAQMSMAMASFSGSDFSRARRSRSDCPPRPVHVALLPASNHEIGKATEVLEADGPGYRPPPYRHPPSGLEGGSLDVEGPSHLVGRRHGYRGATDGHQQEVEYLAG